MYHFFILQEIRTGLYIKYQKVDNLVRQFYKKNTD